MLIRTASGLYTDPDSGFAETIQFFYTIMEDLFHVSDINQEIDTMTNEILKGIYGNNNDE